MARSETARVADFSNIRVKGEGRVVKTTTVTIDGLEGMTPVLTCKPANEDNPRFHNPWQRLVRRQGRRIDTKELRIGEMDLIAKHCVVGWEEGSVVDANGPLPFSVANCQALFRMILERSARGREAIDALRDQLGDPMTFVEDDDEDDAGGAAALEDQAGN